MNLMALLDNVNVVANAPKGITALRSLILKLGISGKLVVQRNDETPAKDLMDQVSRRLDASKEHNPLHDNINAILVNESQYRLPNGWVWISLGKLGRWASGCGFPKNYQGSKSGEILFCKVSDMNLPGNERFINLTENTISADVATKLNAKPNPSGTVIFPKIGGAIATNKRRLVSRPTVIDNNCLGLQPIGLTDPDWLLIVLKGIDFARYQSGTSVPSISQNSLSPIRIGLPPLEEQKRIVAKVDELMRLCDRLEAQQQEREKLLPLLSRANHTRFVAEPTEVNLRAIFHEPGAASPEELQGTILTLAVKGTLVPSKHSPTISSLSSALAEPSSNGVSTGPTKDTGATEILRISAGTSRSDFFVDEEDFKHVDLPQKEIEKHRLKTGDLLACRFNGNLRFVGRFSYYRGESGRVQVNPDKLIRFRVDTTKHCPRYVCFAMNAEPTRKAIEALCATTAGNIGLSAGKLKNVELPLPELEQQRRIAERVTQLMEIVDRLEFKRKQASGIAETFAKAAVAAITSTEFTENERMKPPKTEVVTALKVGKKPKQPDAAPLAALLSEQKAEASAKTLWQLSGLEIDAFYRQLKTETANGWIEEDTSKRDIKEVEVG